MRKPKRLPLPKRFSVAMTDPAYARLRALNDEWHLGNNYLLTILLENFDRVVDADRFDAVMREFVAAYGQPSSGGMADRPE